MLSGILKAYVDLQDLQAGDYLLPGNQLRGIGFSSSRLYEDLSDQIPERLDLPTARAESRGPHGAKGRAVLPNGDGNSLLTRKYANG